MPFKIIRDDIARVQADAIVNSANPNPTYGAGVDAAIYHAAGEKELLAERRNIGVISCGDAVATKAYAMHAKYIIHTVGPEWIDGKHRELQLLESCYRRSLSIADQLHCESIAFPLISTGVYGFPKDKALQTAIQVFSSFLTNHEMQITLVVYDTASFQLSSGIMGDINAYIDASYIERAEESHLVGASVSNAKRKRNVPNAFLSMRESFAEEADYSPAAALDFEDLGESFHDKLFDLILKSGMENKEIYKRANLDRKLFSKIQCDPNYHPRKKTVMALCIALRLNLEQSKDLMSRADWAFSPSSKVDLIVQKAILDEQYDIFQLNTVLFKYTNEILGN